MCILIIGCCILAEKRNCAFIWLKVIQNNNIVADSKIYFRFVAIHIYFPINIVKGYTHHVCVKFQA